MKFKARWVTGGFIASLVRDAQYWSLFSKLQHISRKIGEISLAGSNPSAEEADEGTDETHESGIDIVLNQRLQECYAFGDKKSFTGYLKDYMKK
jgi:hypothetical protein